MAIIGIICKHTVEEGVEDVESVLSSLSEQVILSRHLSNYKIRSVRIIA